MRYVDTTQALESQEMFGETSGESDAEIETLAAELLGVQSDAELEQFLGDIFKKVGAFAKKGAQALGSGLKTIGQAALPILKDVAKTAIPLAAKAVGTYFGGPAGGAIAGQVGSMAAGLIKEIQSLPPEDREFEGAKRFVQLATAAAKDLAAQPPTGNANAAAARALTAAAKVVTAGAKQGAEGGRWFRRGNTIVVEGL